MTIHRLCARPPLSRPSTLIALHGSRPVPGEPTSSSCVVLDRPRRGVRVTERDGVRVTARDLLDFRSAGGEVALAGACANVSVTAPLLASWLRGVGVAAITRNLAERMLAEVLQALPRPEGLRPRGLCPEGHGPAEAEEVFGSVTAPGGFPTFLTMSARGPAA